MSALDFAASILAAIIVGVFLTFMAAFGGFLLAVFLYVTIWLLEFGGVVLPV